MSTNCQKPGKRHETDSPHTLRKEPALLTFGSRSCSFQNHETVSCCCLTHSVYSTWLWPPKKTNMSPSRGPVITLDNHVASSLCLPSRWLPPKHPAGKQSHHSEEGTKGMRCVCWGGTSGQTREVVILPLCPNVATTYSSAGAECLPNLSFLPAAVLGSSSAHMFTLCPSVLWGLREDCFSGSQQGSWIPETRMPGITENCRNNSLGLGSTSAKCFLALGPWKSHTEQARTGANCSGVGGTGGGGGWQAGNNFRVKSRW